MIKKILLYMILFWLICILSLEFFIIIQDVFFNKIDNQQIKTLKTIGFYKVK